MLALRVNNDFYTGNIPAYGFPVPAVQTRLEINKQDYYHNAILDICLPWDKVCKRRKAAAQAAASAAQAGKEEFQSGLLDYLKGDTKSGKIPTGMYVIAGLGILAILGVSYFAFIKK